jgi:protein-tyrosine phosphatase
MNLLFVCSRNQWRSPTAEEIFKNSQEHQVKSAGTEPSARIKLTEKLINWADIIFVMEKKHKDRIEQRFATVVDEKELIVLDIPDDYQFMDEELVDLIKLSVSAYL